MLKNDCVVADMGFSFLEWLKADNFAYFKILKLINILNIGADEHENLSLKFNNPTAYVSEEFSENDALSVASSAKNKSIVLLKVLNEKFDLFDASLVTNIVPSTAIRHDIEDPIFITIGWKYISFRMKLAEFKDKNLGFRERVMVVYDDDTKELHKKSEALYLEYQSEYRELLNTCYEYLGVQNNIVALEEFFNALEG